MFDLPLDSEQLGVLAADPEDERLVPHDDFEVVVRDPAAEGLDHRSGLGPHPLDDAVDLHRAILDLSPLPVPFVRHPESVTIVAVDGGEIVLVSQTRRGAAGRVLELPAGTVEEGESAADAARRELAEECGLAASSWEQIGGFWVVPAYSTEYSHVFVASGLTDVDSPHVDEDEDIAVEHVPIATATSRVEDAGSLAALALWRDL